MPELTIPYDPMFPSNSDDYTRAFYDSLLIEPRYIGSRKADTRASYFGRTYASPIMIAPFAGAPGIAAAAKTTNTLFWGVHMQEADYEYLRGEGLAFVDASKPIGDEALMVRRIQTAEERGATAFFIDIDHLFTPKTGGWMTGHDGIAMGRHTPALLERYVKCSSLPIILKGVMSPADAALCREAGVAAVVASHHHGSPLWAVPPALAASRIRAAVGPDYPVFVDCGVVSGVDAFKALALGASGVLVARHLIPYYKQGGGAAVAERLEEMRKELAAYLSITGATSIYDINPNCLIRKTF